VNLTRRIRLRGKLPSEQLSVGGDRALQIELGGREQAALQLPGEDRYLACSRVASAAGAREAIPRAREREKVGARATAVRREHGAHAAASVDVGAGDDRLSCLHALEHRGAGRRGQAVDRAAKLVDRCGAFAVTLCHRLSAGALGRARDSDDSVGRRQGFHMRRGPATVRDR
jgi:hypothetical protein